MNDGEPSGEQLGSRGGDEVHDEGPSGGDSEFIETIVSEESGIHSDVPRLCEGSGGRKRRRSESSSAIDLADWAGMDEPGTESERKRCVRVFNELQASSGYYLSDVIECETDANVKKFARYIRENSDAYRRGLLLLSTDKTHLHVVHDCSFSNNSCRCAWFKKAEIMHGFRRRGRSKRRRPLSNQLEVSDIENIFFYFTNEGRRTCYLKIAGRVERVPNEASTMAFKRSEGCEGLAGQSEQSSQDDDPELRRKDFTETDGCVRNRRRGREAVSEKRRCKTGNRQWLRMEKIVTLCKNYPMSPVEGILGHPVWLKDPELKFLGGDNIDVKSALNNWTKSLCSWHIEDFKVLYDDDDCVPTFSAGYNNISNYYYDVKTSCDILDELVKYQFDHDEEYCSAFVTTLYEVLERKIPKMNTIYIRSPPSSGKNYFFDCIKDYFLNVGHMCRANKYNNFAFQDAEGRRLVLWNEPNYSPEFIEILKELLGGDSTNVSVKYKAEVPVYRTPIIILTNNVLTIEKAHAFQDRMKVYLWKPAPYLRDYDKKPHPLATYSLFQKYGLVK